MAIESIMKKLRHVNCISRAMRAARKYCADMLSEGRGEKSESGYKASILAELSPVTWFSARASFCKDAMTSASVLMGGCTKKLPSFSFQPVRMSMLL